MPPPGRRGRDEMQRFAGDSSTTHTPFHTCGFVSERTTRRGRVWLSDAGCRLPAGHISLWTSHPESLVYTGPTAGSLVASFSSSTTREADLSAQRTTPQAQAWVSRPDGDMRRPNDPQTASRPRPQSPHAEGFL